MTICFIEIICFIYLIELLPPQINFTPINLFFFIDKIPQITYDFIYQ